MERENGQKILRESKSNGLLNTPFNFLSPILAKTPKSPPLSKTKRTAPVVPFLDYSKLKDPYDKKALKFKVQSEG